MARIVKGVPIINKKSAAFSVQVEWVIYDQVKKMAQRRGIKAADVVRDAIGEYLKKNLTTEQG